MAKTIALLIAIFSVNMGVALASSGVEATNEVPEWMTKVCKQEDSANCQWNAETMGNGEGWSFYSRRIPGTNKICRFYIDHPKKDNCSKR